MIIRRQQLNWASKPLEPLVNLKIKYLSFNNRKSLYTFKPGNSNFFWTNQNKYLYF